MNIQQLEYIVAVDTYRHFSSAAEKCFVTQATLSMMIRKLEEELNIIIFDRSKQPVKPSAIGELIIAQARKILAEIGQVQTLIDEHHGKVTGELHLGIIPTLAPYVLPKFLQNFTKKYPLVHLKVSEFITEHIISRLRNGKLDAGLVATPLEEKGIIEEPIFYEQFMLYTNNLDNHFKKKYILAEDIDVDRLLLLEEGHCMRSQLMNFCTLKKTHSSSFEYEAGSIETLVKMVDMQQGITIIPELAANDMSAKQQRRLYQFRSPQPAREISLVYHRIYQKQKLLQLVVEEIRELVPPHMLKKQGNVLNIE